MLCRLKQHFPSFPKIGILCFCFLREITTTHGDIRGIEIKSCSILGEVAQFYGCSPKASRQSRYICIFKYYSNMQKRPAFVSPRRIHSLTAQIQEVPVGCVFVSEGKVFMDPMCMHAINHTTSSAFTSICVPVIPWWSRYRPKIFLRMLYMFMSTTRLNLTYGYLFVDNPTYLSPGCGRRV